MGMQEVVDALLGSTGPERTAWLTRQNKRVEDAGRYYLGPAYDKVAAVPKVLAMLSPGADMIDMQQQGGDLMASRSPGDAMRAGLGLGAATLGMAIPGTAKGISEGVEGATQGIRAYHGSPHDFDRFSMDKIGTGEGAQAYGHGLYFAESEGVAKSYKDALAPRAGVTAGSAPLSRQSIRDIADELGMDRAPATAANVFERMSKSDSVDDYLNKLGEVNIEELRATFPQVATEMDNEIRLVSELKARGLDIDRPNKGHMYEVNINANPDDFLDWDKPLSEQSEKVRAFVAANPELSRKLDFQRDFLKQDPRGSAAYTALAKGPVTGNDPAASGALREAGIPGIRYLDAGSRTAGDGSRNYVVFDDSLVSILRKYGILGGLGIPAMGGIYGSEERQ